MLERVELAGDVYAVEEVHGWLSKLWSLFGSLLQYGHLAFRVPKKGP